MTFFLPSCFVPLLFCFFLQAKMTATPTTKTIISGERTPPINGNIPATEIEEIKKQTSEHEQRGHQQIHFIKVSFTL